MNWYEFLLRNRNEVFERSLEHVGLVGASMAISLAIGLPLGIALVSRPRLQRWVIGAANVVQTIPSLALFGFLIPGTVDRRHWGEHGHCGALSVRIASHFAKYNHGDRGGRSGGRRVRAGHGNDFAAGALASAVAAGGSGLARGNTGRHSDLHWSDHDRRRDRRRGPGSFYFSRTGDG